jgi:hypothetical protein
MKPRLAIFLVAALVMVLLQPALAHACPGCKQALANAEGEQANMVNGYFWSILFMLSMPFTLFGTFCGAMYLAVRKARKERAGQGVASGYAHIAYQEHGDHHDLGHHYVDQEVDHESLTVTGLGV